MNKVTKIEVKKLADSLYFDLSNKEEEAFCAEINELIGDFKFLKSIDLSKYGATDFGACHSASSFRKDVIKESDGNVLKNCSNLSGNLVEVK